MLPRFSLTWSSSALAQRCDPAVAEIASVQGDVETRLPEGRIMPEHWISERGEIPTDAKTSTAPRGDERETDWTREAQRALFLVLALGGMPFVLTFTMVFIESRLGSAQPSMERERSPRPSPCEDGPMTCSLHC